MQQKDHTNTSIVEVGLFSDLHIFYKWNKTSTFFFSFAHGERHTEEIYKISKCKIVHRSAVVHHMSIFSMLGKNPVHSKTV